MVVAQRMPDRLELRLARLACLPLAFASLSIGCDSNMSLLTLGWEPLAAQGRTGVDAELSSDGSVDVGATYSMVVKAAGQPATLLLMHFALGYSSRREDGSGGNAHWTWFDGGVAVAQARGGPGFALGVSLAHLDSTQDGYDSFGPGGFARGFYRLHGESRVGLKFHGELHGWVGFGGEGVDLAGRAAAGLSLVAIF
ncbi:MAG: hypothetical protein ACYS9X_08285 [Planctomycetota bacterium]|jgi:hypothetical protein